MWRISQPRHLSNIIWALAKLELPGSPLLHACIRNLDVQVSTPSKCQVCAELN